MTKKTADHWVNHIIIEFHHNVVLKLRYDKTFLSGINQHSIYVWNKEKKKKCSQWVWATREGQEEQSGVVALVQVERMSLREQYGVSFQWTFRSWNSRCLFCASDERRRPCPALSSSHDARCTVLIFMNGNTVMRGLRAPGAAALPGSAFKQPREQPRSLFASLQAEKKNHALLIWNHRVT